MQRVVGDLVGHEKAEELEQDQVGENHLHAVLLHDRHVCPYLVPLEHGHHYVKHMPHQFRLVCQHLVAIKRVVKQLLMV